jgi:hypothetical protein
MQLRSAIPRARYGALAAVLAALIALANVAAGAPISPSGLPLSPARSSRPHPDPLPHAGEGEEPRSLHAVEEEEPRSQATTGREPRTQFVLLGLDTTPRSPHRGLEELFENINGGRPPDAPRATFTVFSGTGGLQLDERRTRLTPEELPFAGVPPRHNPVFRYAQDLAEIRATAENVRRLAALGVEIGSHTVRHAHGGAWARERWELEVSDHARILELVGLDAPAGFRAPFLETSPALYSVLDAHGFTYDASLASSERRWPSRYPGTNVWVFSVPRVAIPGRARRAIFYDLNLDHRLRRAAIEAGVHGEPAISEWMDDAYYDAAYAELMRRYRGGRAPLLVSGHGGFQRAIGRLMRRVCLLPDVRCGTFSEATDYLRAHPELEGAE